MYLTYNSTTNTQILVLTIRNAILLKHCKHYKLITNFDQIRDHAPLEEYVKSFRLHLRTLYKDYLVFCTLLNICYCVDGENISGFLV